jgi:hypothetical protein
MSRVAGYQTSRRFQTKKNHPGFSKEVEQTSRVYVNEAALRPAAKT